MTDKATGESREIMAFKTRRGEFGTILFLALVIAPLLVVTFVGSYGFVIWMLQLIGGPPTH